jgi:hypothetical protein
MKIVYVVTIYNGPNCEVARAFTNASDAHIFVDECERVEPNDKFEYFIDPVTLDGDPLGNY